MTRTLALLLSASLSASLAACAGHAEVRYRGGSDTPEYVTLENDPSVMVVANADEPVFYSENMYWLYRNDRWYRSSSHRGGWSRVDTVPEHVRRIERPQAYVHIRPPGARTTQNLREHRIDEPAPPAQAPDRDPRALDSEPADGRPPVSPDATRPAPTPAPTPDPDRAATPPNRPDPTPDPVLRDPNYAPPGSGPRTPGSTGPAAPNQPSTVPDAAPPAAPSTPKVPAPPVDPDRPGHQVAPDPDRAPTSPGEPARPDDRRPAADRDNQRNELGDPGMGQRRPGDAP